jgi:hypothetical protein
MLPSMGANGATDGSVPSTTAALAAQSSTIWRLLLVVPAVAVVCQLLLWRRYTLHGAYLKQVQTALEEPPSPPPPTHEGGEREAGSLDADNGADRHV